MARGLVQAVNVGEYWARDSSNLSRCRDRAPSHRPSDALVAQKRARSDVQRAGLSRAVPHLQRPACKKKHTRRDYRRHPPGARRSIVRRPRRVRAGEHPPRPGRKMPNIRPLANKNNDETAFLARMRTPKKKEEPR